MKLEKPGSITLIGVLTLIDGFTNILLFIGLGITFLSLFFTIICTPILILPIVVAVFEFILAVKLLRKPSKPIGSPTGVAILQISSIIYGNIVGLVTGIIILALVNTNNEVKDYFETGGLYSPVRNNEGWTPPPPPKKKVKKRS